METTAFFKELFEYSCYFNNELITLFIEKETTVPERASALLNHILNAHQIWLERVQGVPPSCTVWEMRSLASLEGVNRQNYEGTLKLLDAVPLNTMVAYNTFKGIQNHNTVRDILFHIINHSTYHRAQIATDLRASGIAPLVTDYIFWKRNDPLL